MRKNVITALFFLFILPSMTTAAYNGGKNNNQQNNLAVRSAQQAAQIAKHRYNGKVLKVQNSKVKGHAGYKVKLLKKDGHIISVSIDAKTGNVSPQ